MLYIEYMSISLFIAGVARGDGSECGDPVEVRAVSASQWQHPAFILTGNPQQLVLQCAQRIGKGVTAYGLGVAYFAM
jgi:hypothetical protein